ncbi:uncharacterized protein [Spinacia oleracea]|uniref:Uncharacterized protein isoform X2 n=1 Tax=Spinacia oleracea TaxID=3562 RepID=A0ABM3RA45_SPIOL|nr:uncharacterized protein LOC110796777 isoform X2 [Spinacia oleracea]
MKGNKPKAHVAQIPEYERKRLEKIRLNAERMQAKGVGFLANKILEKSQGFNFPSGKFNEMIEENDDESSSEYDGNNEEDENTSNMEAQKVVCGKKKVSKPMTRSSTHKRSMADFVKMNNPKQQHQVEQVDDSNITSSIRNIQEKYNQKKFQPCDLPNCEKSPRVLMSQKKQKKKVYCTPGSMLQYLEYRKKNPEQNEVVVGSNMVSNTLITAPMRDVDDDLELYENDNDVGYASKRDFELEMEALGEYENKGSKSKKHRGPTKLTKVHARTREERQTIILNSLGQPVGPTPEIIGEFKFFLRTVAKDPELAPLNYCSFPSLPTLDRIWDYVLICCNIILLH